MKVTQRFTVADSPERVWHLLSDVRAVAACVPGLELTDERDDGVYLGRFVVKVGPLTAKLDGEGRLSRDDATSSGRVEGKGIDKKGGSRAKGTLRYAVASDPAGAAVEIEADFTLSGPLAQVGRTGIVEDVARALTEEFAGNVSSRLGAAADRPSVEEPVNRTPDRAEPDADPSETAPAPAPNRAPPRTEHFDAGSALSQAFWSRLLQFLKRILGLGRDRNGSGPAQ